MTPSRIEVIAPQTVPPLAVGARDAARMLGICEKTLRDLAAAGEIPSLRIGNRLLFRLSSLDAWLQARESTPAEINT